MEPRELQLLEKFCAKDAELKILWEEHLLYEQQLEKMEKRSFLPPHEAKVVKELKKKKLSGKTKIQSILDRYKSMEA